MTICENWSRYRLLYAWHPAETMTMFVPIGEFIFGELAGNKAPSHFGSEDMQPGFRETHSRLVIPAGLQYAKAFFETIRGRSRSAATRKLFVFGCYRSH